MRIELTIDRLVADGLDGRSADDLVAALTDELRLVLTREFAGQAGRRRLSGRQTISVPRLRTALAFPPAGPGTGTAPGPAAGGAARASTAGRAIGAALGGAVTGNQIFRRGSIR
jgi:hypothetical protein